MTEQANEMNRNPLPVALQEFELPPAFFEYFVLEEIR